MFKSHRKRLREVYRRVISSIAFLPAIIALLFLALAVLMIYFDFSPAGKDLKSNMHWLSIKDASTARSICSAIAGGVLSLAVFSFSMVMILLSQAASQMSNRILGRLISNRFQQVVLGFYIGTIVYALFLLTTIRDINSGIYVPAISTYLLITITVVDIFLFIYFLHYITQSVKYETIIQKIYVDTKAGLRKDRASKNKADAQPLPLDAADLQAPVSGRYQGFDQKGMVDLCREHEAVIFMLYPRGSYVLKNTPVLKIESSKQLPEDFIKDVKLLVSIGWEQEIRTNYYYGFRQLTEIAIKALSPGINDPGTAIISLQALGDLLSYSMRHHPVTCYADEANQVRIVASDKTFDQLFDECVLPIWDYGKNDRLLQHEMLHVLLLLDSLAKTPAVTKLLLEVRSSIH